MTNVGLILKVTKQLFFLADENCQNMDSRLASIHSDFENDFLVHKMGNAYKWIGYYRENSSSKFEWVDGSNDEFQKWYHTPADDDLFTLIQTSEDGFWHGIEDQTNYGKGASFICNKEAHNFKSCPPGWDHNGHYCYLQQHKPMTMADARASCVDKRSELVSIADFSENSYLKSTFETRSNEANCPEGWDYFEGSNECFLWVTEEIMSMG